jgi:hypothetical protein
MNNRCTSIDKLWNMGDMNIIDAYASINRAPSMMLLIKIYPHLLSPNSYDLHKDHAECRFIAKIVAILS